MGLRERPGVTQCTGWPGLCPPGRAPPGPIRRGSTARHTPRAWRSQRRMDEPLPLNTAAADLRRSSWALALEVELVRRDREHLGPVHPEGIAVRASDGRVRLVVCAWSCAP